MLLKTYKTLPIDLVKGEDVWVWDTTGKKYLDLYAGHAVTSTGHCHPDVVRAIQRQAGELIHMSGTDFYFPLLAQVAEKLAQIPPGNAPKRV